ncbi:MAG: ABC transporter ATP-binding protein/permease [Desulfarculaceae bacterium]|nr:ABC transporter ATP-binding protein/permease [Desulfarculaceae bacterium]
MINRIKNRLTTRQKEVVSLIAAYWKKLLAAMVSMIVVAACTSLSAYLVKPMLDDIFIKQDRQMLVIIPIVAIVVFLLKGIGTYGQEYLMNYVGERIIQFYRNALYQSIIDLPMSFFQKEKTGVLMSRITNDVNVLKGMVSNAVTNVVRDVFTIIGLIGVIFYMDWKLAMGAFLVLPAAFYPVVVFGKLVRKFSTGTQEAMADLNAFLYETFSGSKIVKIFTMEEVEKERFQKKTDTLFNLEMKKAVFKAMSSPVMEFLGGLGIAFIIWFGGSRVISGESTPGTFFSFLTAVMMLYDPVKKLSKLNNTIQEGAAAVTRIYDVLDEPCEIVEKDATEPFDVDSFSVKFEQVKFSYSREDEPVLQDVNIEVEQGEILALVGKSGGGKTSLVNLIPRFHDTTEGNIYIGGRNIRDLSIKSLRSRISIVTQEPILFNESVRDNIRYGRLDATDGEIEDAARAAYAYNFITGFPKGFDTVIGELGNRLSGGEKQRICIARALLKDSPVLILDEATSALDAESEQVVQKALANLMKGRTTFVIAHRLSTVAHASRVILLKNGRIVEQGTHDELMDKMGEYYKLQKMQSSNNVIDSRCKGEAYEYIKGTA